MAKIKLDYPFPHYYVEESAVSKEARHAIDRFVLVARHKLSIDDFCKEFEADPEKIEVFLRQTDAAFTGKPLPPDQLDELASEVKKIFAGNPEAASIANGIVHGLHGYPVIQSLFDDAELEEIMVNGLRRPIMVVHGKYGVCQTNLSFRNAKEYSDLVLQLTNGVSTGTVDVRLPDGSRANIVFPPASEEILVTVRKFRKQRLSIVNLIEAGTISSQAAAFLWLCVEGMRVYPMNIIFAGGAAAGKTSMLSAVAEMIPPHERIITIEDTRELALDSKQGWVALEKTSQADLDDLLRNALRMRPDRVIVGEVRGGEAQTLFTAMNIGQRGVLGTLHANSDRDAVQRLESAPMSVPRDLIPLLNLIVVQHRVYEGGELQRRVTQISEVSRIEDKIALNDVFKWDSQSKRLERTELPSEAIERLATLTNNTVSEVIAEVGRRRQALEYLSEQGIREPSDVAEFMSRYYAEAVKK